MCPTTTYESQCMTTDSTPAALAKSRPKRTASYSASLLVIENWRWIVHSIVSPIGDRSKTSAPPACWLNELSVHIIHVIGFFLSSSPVVNSAMKSTKACALIVVLGRYWTSNSLSSIAHRTSHPAPSFDNSLFVWTTMVCAWMYDLSFRTTVINAKASFSIGGYLPSAPQSAQLV